jgi:uncharacterized protein YbjQ (UPF0145 family)
MDKPFSADSSPFLVPYPSPNPAVPGIKPFTAIDLVPPLAQPPSAGGPRLNAPPQASPFLDPDPVKPFPGPAAAPAAKGPMEAGPTLFGSPAPVTPVRPAFQPEPMAPPAPAPKAASAGPAPQADAALRASATPRRGSGTEAYAKSTLTMTDADASAEAPGLLISTGPNVEGRRIQAYLGVVSVEIVIPKDVLFRNPAPYGDLHRIKAAEEHLQVVKRKAFEELAAKARALGADAVVGTTLQFSQFDAMVCLCAALGTAVKIE